MQASTLSNTGRLSLVEPHQVFGSIGPAAPETLGTRVLELSSILQTTLDIDQQFQLFSSTIQQHLQIDGVKYHQPDHDDRPLSTGNTTTHRATYDLVLEGQSLGNLHFYREVPFTTHEIQILENLLCGLIYPLRNAINYLDAINMASYDPLTGVQNRLAMAMAMAHEVSLAERQQTPLSLMVIDADNFKRFNDQYGHAFGDEVLRTLASKIKEAIRCSDLLFRFGGEEFVVLAANTDRDGALLLAERIRATIDEVDQINNQQIDFSVSIGVAQRLTNEQADKLFERADAAMYQAKNSSRNRAVAA